MSKLQNVFKLIFFNLLIYKTKRRHQSFMAPPFMGELFSLMGKVIPFCDAIIVSVFI